MWILIFYALLLFLAGLRSTTWSIGHWNRGEWLPGSVFMLLGLAWFAASSALAVLAIH